MSVVDIQAMALDLVSYQESSASPVVGVDWEQFGIKTVGVITGVVFAFFAFNFNLTRSAQLLAHEGDHCTAQRRVSLQALMYFGLALNYLIDAGFGDKWNDNWELKALLTIQFLTLGDSMRWDFCSRDGHGFGSNDDFMSLFFNPFMAFGFKAFFNWFLLYIDFGIWQDKRDTEDHFETSLFFGKSLIDFVAAGFYSLVFVIA